MGVHWRFFLKYSSTHNFKISSAKTCMLLDTKYRTVIYAADCFAGNIRMHSFVYILSSLIESLCATMFISKHASLVTFYYIIWCAKATVVILDSLFSCVSESCKWCRTSQGKWILVHNLNVWVNSKGEVSSLKWQTCWTNTVREPWLSLNYLVWSALVCWLH